MPAPSDDRDRELWAAIPFKGPRGSKRRLAGLLDEPERGRLSLAMLDGVLDAVLGTELVARVLLLLPASVPPPARSDSRLHVVAESTAEQGSMDGLNAALRQAQAVAHAGGAGWLLIVPSDLPLIDASDVVALAAAANGSGAVIAPDRADEGTNALLLAPPLAVAPQFGMGSYARHRELAGRAGLPFEVVRRPGLALDLDTPADVCELLAVDAASRASRLLRELGIGQRLERLGVLASRCSGP